jgi:hypothetical protein
MKLGTEFRVMTSDITHIHRSHITSRRKPSWFVENPSYASVSGACRQDVVTHKKRRFKYSPLIMSTCGMALAMGMAGMNTAEAGPSGSNIVSGDVSIEQTTRYPHGH